MVEIGKFVRVDLSCVIVIHLVSCSYIVSYAFLAYRSISQYPTHSKPPAFSSPERNPPIPAKISKYFISTNHLLSDFSNKKTVKLFSKLDVTLIYSFLHLLLAHYLHLRYGNRPRLGSLRAFCRYQRRNAQCRYHPYVRYFLLCRVWLPFWWKLAKSIYGFTPEIFTLKTQKKLVNTSFSRCAS